MTEESLMRRVDEIMQDNRPRTASDVIMKLRTNPARKDVAA